MEQQFLFDDQDELMLPPNWPVDSDWTETLSPVFAAGWFVKLQKFVKQERSSATVYPPAEETFRAFELTPLKSVKVCILGQDPYHGPGQAHGLCFSVTDGTAFPPSLKNIFRELENDCHCGMPNSGNLESWARQGVLMLNTVLSVRESEANSHKGKGWEKFTDHVIDELARQDFPIVFILWGRQAAAKKEKIHQPNHLVIESAHPSPLSARNGFFESRPFSSTNRFLESQGVAPINWCL